MSNELATNVATSASGISWNLSDLFSSPDDPRIEQTLTSCMSRAVKFQETYQGKINTPDLTAATLVAAIKEYESISQELAKPHVYASLRFSADTSDPANGAFLQKMMEKDTEISIPVIFFSLDICKIPDEVLTPLLSDPELAKYGHFLETTRAFRDHMLSETEETLLEETANTGARAFRRLFEEITSKLKFQYKGQELSQSELLAKLYEADREERRMSAESFSAGLNTVAPTLAFISNTLMQDKNVKDRLRKYKTAEQSRHLSNELSAETVELVATTCENNYSLVNRYYKIKRDVLGLDKLTHYDRYAPLFESDRKVVWNDARALILEAFDAFSPVMSAAAQDFFDKEWIDAAPRPGKRGGAFCAYATPDVHPFILMSYLERSRDVMTLAHELGHGVHSYVSRGQTYFNFHGTLPMAELASTFGEMLVFENLQKDADAKERLALLAGKIEDSFATIFRQATMYRFEQALHKHRREKGELTLQDFGGYWQTAIQNMFGDSLELGDEHKVWWSYISHFIGSPFYVYAYSFGELLVLSLYKMYKKEGATFPEKYLSVLRAGGSLSPQQLMDKVGVKLDDATFWQGGMDVLAAEIAEFEGLWKDYKATK